MKQFCKWLKPYQINTLCQKCEFFICIHLCIAHAYILITAQKIFRSIYILYNVHNVYVHKTMYYTITKVRTVFTTYNTVHYSIQQVIIVGECTVSFITNLMDKGSNPGEEDYFTVHSQTP